MKVGTIVLAVVLFVSEGMALGSRFIGPDSTNWRSLTQMDITFTQGVSPRIGVGSLRGVCVRSGNVWRYVAPDIHRVGSVPQHLLYREVHFSPWDESMVFLGYNTISFGVKGSAISRIPDANAASWYGFLSISGGSGYNPSLSVGFSPRRNGLAFSWMDDLYETTNEGTTWTKITGLGSHGAVFVAVDEAIDSVLYAARQVGGNYQLSKSADNGASWNFVRQIVVSQPADSSQRVGDMIANGDTLIFALNHFPLAANSSCGIYVSTNGGSSWSQPVSGVNVQRLSRDPKYHESIFAAAQGAVYRSHTGGVAWEVFTNSLQSPNLVDIRKDPYSDTLYVATSDQGVYALYDLPTAVAQTSETPTVFALRQNYPNPFNPSTSVTFDLPRRSHVVLTVYDLLGREIATLVDGDLDSGRHDVIFAAENLASGIYFYRLQADSWSQVRKMILQK